MPNTNISRPNSVLLGQKDPTPRRSTLPLATNGVANALGRSSPAESGVVWSPYISLVQSTFRTRQRLHCKDNLEAVSGKRLYHPEMSPYSANQIRRQRGQKLSSQRKRVCFGNALARKVGFEPALITVRTIGRLCKLFDGLGGCANYSTARMDHPYSASELFLATL